MFPLVQILYAGKGKEISDLYCKPFSSSELTSRQKYLAKYNFSCQCPACSQDWPQLHGLHASLEDLPARQYKQNKKQINNQVRLDGSDLPTDVRCPDILQIKRVLRAQENYNKVEKKSDVSESELVSGIVSVLEELHKLVKAPHQQIVYWENRLHQALLYSHAARVKMTGSRNAKIMWPDLRQ